MRARPTIRPVLMLAMALTCAAAATGAQEPPTAGRVLLDRVVAIVNNNAILASDVDREMRLSMLEPRRNNEAPDRRNTLNRLIGRTLIQQQIRREEEDTVTPSDEDVQARIAILRAQLPECVRDHCTTDEGWRTFLAENRLTTNEVERYIRLRLQFLSFIETRFRQGIRISPEEIEAYYNSTLLPQYPAGQTAPSLESVSSRIEEILLQEQVNKLFSAWLDNLRKQGEVQILDPALEMPGVQGGGSA
jgi:peptidyl-prolyl cis-trans isomerase SurA